MKAGSPTTLFGRSKAPLLVRATCLSMLVSLAAAFFATPMLAFADGGVNDVNVMGIITFGNQIKLAANQAVDPQKHLPVFAFKVNTDLTKPIPQGTWLVVKWKNVNCNGDKISASNEDGVCHPRR